MGCCHVVQGADESSLLHLLASCRCHCFLPASHFLYSQLKHKYTSVLPGEIFDVGKGCKGLCNNYQDGGGGEGLKN